MGFITKRIHQKTTNRIVVPIRWVTALDIDQVLYVLQALVAETPPKTGFLQGGHKLWLFGQAPGPWRVYFGPPDRKDPTKVVRSWMAHVTMQASSRGDQTMVTLELMQWRTTDGKLNHRGDWEQFRDGLATRLAGYDPSFRSLEAV